MKIEIASGIGVADRWRDQYFRDGEWANTVTGNSGDIYERLCELGPNPDIDAVAEVIGNKSWSYLNCDFCSSYVKKAAIIGDYESKLICSNCAREAHAALNSQ